MGGDAIQVEIRRLDPGNFALVASWLSDPAINRLLTIEWRGRAVESRVMAIAVRNQRNLLYEVHHAGALSGLVAFSELEPRDRSAMIWYCLGDRGLAGRGVTTRAVAAMCRVGFQELGLACIWAMVLAPNAASMRLLEKVGFQRAGRLRQVECIEGAQVDRHYFDLLPGELRHD